MPRRRRLRKMVEPPRFKGYKPYGCTKPNEWIELNYEEYEAIKLADHDLMNHEEASKLMDVSRATFARIYESARRKIADALVNVKEIKTVFGNAEFEDDWMLCTSCHARYTLPTTSTKSDCPLCKSIHTESISKDNN